MKLFDFLKTWTAGLTLCSAVACTTSAPEREVYLFTGHREPALDGLHLLYSYDGYRWDSLQGSWLEPMIGNKAPEYHNYLTGKPEKTKFAPQSMMRDPSIVQGPDGTFHLVWTLAWAGERAFGHASSKDLIHWSEQRAIPVMEDEPTNNVWAPEIFYDETIGAGIAKNNGDALHYTFLRIKERYGWDVYKKAFRALYDLDGAAMEHLRTPYDKLLFFLSHVSEAAGEDVVAATYTSEELELIRRSLES